MAKVTTSRALKRKDDARREEARQRLAADVVEVLSTSSGRRFLWHLLQSEGFLFDASFSVENPHVTSFYEGKRSVAIALMQLAQQVAPREYVLMMDEELRAKADKVVQRAADEAALERESDDGNGD
ncbi:MAG TPA: hypothetical protein VMK12_07035 [Anaeromyxobacteraceae bacterium]|nr:hypothetical protein [Anaeromyxobacteraceae bacterium]